MKARPPPNPNAKKGVGFKIAVSRQFLKGRYFFSKGFRGE
jgi:hypothetical protein